MYYLLTDRYLLYDRGSVGIVFRRIYIDTRETACIIIYRLFYTINCD